ncbi:MAG: hypothetical protein KBS43_03890 [Oscillospiraceae bacterium]|nr:hypothetical protein [Candidatus Limimonas coprohippi]
MKLIINKKGSALLWVILMTIIITILLGAVLAATYAYFNYTTYTVKRQQAYFTARSAISTCLEEFSSAEQTRNTTTGEYNESNISILPKPNSTVKVTDFGFGENMGTATADISRNDEDEVTVEVTATYADQTYKMKATVMRQPLYFAGIAIKNLTLKGNLNLASGTDLYWNNTAKFDPSSSSINTGNYSLTVNGNFVSKGDARIPAGMTVASHKFTKAVNFTNDGRHSRKIWNPNEYIISNKTLQVDDSSSTEYTSSVINTLSRITDTHPVYCNNGPKVIRGGAPEAFGSKVATTADSPLYKITGALGLNNIINDVADENLKLSNSENDAMAIQYIEVLSLSNTIDNAVEDAKNNSRTLIGYASFSALQGVLDLFNNIKYNYLDASYIDYSSTDENNRSDEVIPLTYMFVRGGDKSGLTVRVRYGNEPGKRSGIGQFVQGVSNNVGDLINRVFSIDRKPSYMVFYLEKNATLHIGYDDDGKRTNNKEDLVFLYSVYGGDGTTVVLHDGVTVLGEIICDHLIVEGDVNLIYTSTSGSQIAKQKIAEYWAVSNYSD